jgi:4-hydroxy-tetrahydrodipicolinate reductase
MTTFIFGDGHLGRAIAAALAARDEPPPILLGRPPDGGHHPARLRGADLAFEASRAEAVAGNVSVALAAGCRRFVVATTGWDDGRDALDGALRAHGATAVAAPNFSLGVAGLLRLVEVAGRLFARVDEFEPYVLEWHRRGKADRPSGTAREIARRLLAVDPRKREIAPNDGGPPAPDQLEVASLRAGSSPGMHVVGFDAPGETVELRLAARDRSAYATGALAAADWLRAEPRIPGIHSFDEVVDELFGAAASGVGSPSVKLRAVAGYPG